MEETKNIPLERIAISMIVSPCGPIKNLLYNFNILDQSKENVLNKGKKFYELLKIAEHGSEGTDYKKEVLNEIKEKLDKEGKLDYHFLWKSKFNRELTEEEKDGMRTNHSYI